MEEYLTAAHILTDGKDLLKKNQIKEAKNLLRNAFASALDNITVYYMELFFTDIFFLLKNNIIETDKLKKVADIYYKTLEILMLSYKEFAMAAILRENKRWIDFF